MRTIHFCVLCLALTSATCTIADPVPEAQRWWPSAWGAEDERGAANRMTSGKVLEARALITTGKVYSLGRVYEEGMPLFGKGIPMFPNPRLIIHEKDGAEVARLMGDSDAIMLQGHGAATVGGDMEDAVINMLHLEEQARMNYLAFCAVGSNHATLTKEQAQDFVANMRSMPDADHLKPQVAPTPRKPSGIWLHYTELAHLHDDD